MDDFEKELRTGFLDEASQLLADSEQCFLTLEKNPNDAGVLNQLFRLAHNLKGSSKAVGFDDLGHFTHELESFLLKLKNKELSVQTHTINLLLRCNDHILKMVEGLRDNMDARFDSTELIAEIKENISGKVTGTIDGAYQDQPIVAPIQTEAKVDPILARDIEEQFRVQAKEMHEKENIPTIEDAIKEDGYVIFDQVKSDDDSVNVNSLQTEHVDISRSTEVQKVNSDKQSVPIASNSSGNGGGMSGNVSNGASGGGSSSSNANNDESIRVSLLRLEKLIDYVGEMVILQTVLQEQSGKIENINLKKSVQQMAKITKEVQDISMGLRMIPLKQTFFKLQRIVRDISKVINKTVVFTMHGEETEVDKTVLENLSDPLVHVIRNAIDHGIETPEVRVTKGKAASGNISLSAFHHSGKLVIEVQDDGAGIDPEKLTKYAIEKGILKPGTKLSDKEAIELIFHPGFSTKTEVTDISGRGVGMDVVKTNIEKMQGEVIVTSVVGKGSKFRIVLPLTLAIIDGLVISCKSDRYVLPISHVHESVRVSESEIRQTKGLGELFMLRGEPIPIFRLDRILGKVNNKSEQKEMNKLAIVVRTDDSPFAVLVDDVIGQQQVVTKKLGAEMSHVIGYAGSSILGDGKPALILELSELVKSKHPPIKSSHSEQRRVVA